MANEVIRQRDGEVEGVDSGDGSEDKRALDQALQIP